MGLGQEKALDSMTTNGGWVWLRWVLKIRPTAMSVMLDFVHSCRNPVRHQTKERKLAWAAMDWSAIHSYYCMVPARTGSYLYHSRQHHRTITLDPALMTDNCMNTLDISLTVISSFGNSIKMHTELNTVNFRQLYSCTNFHLIVMYSSLCNYVTSSVVWQM